MEAIVTKRSGAGIRPFDGPATTDQIPAKLIGALFPDPLDPDDVGDEIVLTTRRAIGRVALVATEAAAAARSVRDGRQELSPPGNTVIQSDDRQRAGAPHVWVVS